MDLLLLVKVLWRKIWILIAIPVIAAAAAYLFTMNTVQTYKASAQLSTGFTTNDQVLLSDEKFSIRDADVRFNNLMNMLNSGITRNLLSYRLLLHDLNPVEVPYHRPDPNLYTFTQQEKEEAYKIIKQRLDSLRPLVGSDKDYPLVRKFLHGYRYTYDDINAGLAISRIPNTDYIQVDFTSD